MQSLQVAFCCYCLFWFGFVLFLFSLPIAPFISPAQFRRLIKPCNVAASVCRDNKTEKPQSAPFAASPLRCLGKAPVVSDLRRVQRRAPPQQLTQPCPGRPPLPGGAAEDARAARSRLRARSVRASAGGWFGSCSQPALGFLFWFVFLEERLSEELGYRGKC